MTCIKCDLHFNRINELSGIGNEFTSIAFLFDYPRAYESKKGEPFSNRKFKTFFAELQEHCNIGLDDAYFTYLVKCPVGARHMDYFKELELQTHNCSDNNLEFNDLPNLKLIIPVGSFATSYIPYMLFNTIVNINNVANTSFKGGSKIYHCLYHPMFLYHNDKYSNDYDALNKTIRKYINPYHNGESKSN